MPIFGIVSTIAGVFGISPFRLIMYASLIVAVVGGGLWVRHHYVSLGYHKALSDVKKQDDRAAAAADAVGQKAQACDNTNGYWDVITQNCKLGDAEEKAK